MGSNTQYGTSAIILAAEILFYQCSGSSPNGQSLESELGQLYLLPLSQNPVFLNYHKTLHIYIPISGQLLLRTLFSTAGRVVSAYESVLCTSRGTRWGVLPYQHKPKRHVPTTPPPPKGMVYVPFRSENGGRLCTFWSGIGYGFRGNYGNVWTFQLFQFQMIKKER